MDINKQAVAGTIQSNDCLVRVVPREEGILIHLDSTVKETFGDEILEVLRETLQELQVTRGEVFVEDKGALNYTLRARVKTAVKRAHE